MNLPNYSSYESQWAHRKEVVYLNHGSFGSTPQLILKKQQQLQEEMEGELIQFMTKTYESLYWENKQALADFVKADVNDMVLIKNATQGVNTILHALHWEEGDEILTHDHAYGACQQALNYYCNRYKCQLKMARIPYPLQNEDQIVQAFLDAISPKTKFALVDHVTSATAIIFPVERIVRELESRGIEVLVDGAHAPGMLDLNLNALGASYYTGNCHKWICSPKGSALLHVRKDKQHKIRPLQISHFHDLYIGSERHWSAQFIWPGTDDYTAWLCIKDSIQFMGNLMGNWENLRRHNRNLCLEARTLVATHLGTELPAPDSMIGHLANILIAENAVVPSKAFNTMPPIKEDLFRDFGIEVPVFVFDRERPRLWLRIAVQAYNSLEQYQYLAKSLSICLNK